jgi:hypothetical protein
MQWFFLLSVLTVLAEISPQCFTHDDCLQPGHFCAWSTCFGEAGDSYSCGNCKPCEKCSCDQDSIDFSCPTIRCPDQPINGVRYLQGKFNNVSSLLEAPDYHCVRQLEVTGNIFSISQRPFYALHPATTAALNEPDGLFSECASFTRSGVISGAPEEMNGQIKFDVIISSEGDPNVR